MKSDTIVSQESNEMAEARKLLGLFEGEMELADGLAHLSEALSLLSDIREGSVSDIEKQVALNIALAYMKKTRARVEPQLSRDPPIRFDNIEEWLKIFWEFEAFGFILPQEIAETKSKLLTEKVTREIELMSPDEKRGVLKKLQAIGI